MKYKNSIFYIFMIFCACNNSPKEKTNTTLLESNQENKLHSTIPIIKNTNNSSKKITIHQESNYSLEYSENELNKVEILFPIFRQEKIKNPDETYLSSGIWKKYIGKNGKEETFSFGSEVGQDHFFLVYAYYLKKLNGEEKFNTERENFIELYRTINEIYQSLNYGGTYFTHQHLRIIGDAEYSVYLLNTKTKDINVNFQKEKTEYLNSLRKRIDKYEKKNIYNEIDKKENFNKYKSRIQSFENKVNYIDKLIKNDNYLKQTENFETENYQ